MSEGLSIKELIQAKLNELYPETATLKQITVWLRREYKDTPGVKHKTDGTPKTKKELRKDVRVYCSRLHKEGAIDRIGQGLYRAATSLDNLHKLEQPPLEVHGIKIEAMVAGLNALQKGGLTVTPSGCGDAEQLADFCETHGFSLRPNGTYTTSQYFCERKVTITVHVHNKAAGLVELWINASNAPLDVMTFDKLITVVLEGFLQPLGFLTDKRVVQCDVAKDFHQLRLDGISCLSLQSFKKGWFKVYYHHQTQATRVEARVTGASMDLEQALRLIISLPGQLPPPASEYAPPPSSDNMEVA